VEAVWIVLIIFGFAFLTGLVAVIRFPEDVRAMLQRTESVEVTRKGFAWKMFKEAVERKEKREPSREEIESNLNRISGGRILWVDDNPANNRLEVQALRASGIQIDTAVSNDEALNYAERRHYDLVLSDIGREAPQEPEAGLALPGMLEQAHRPSPVAYYVGHADKPQTPHGQPVFDTPTELLQFVAAHLEGIE
jgi:CheY-like chemotaxis protein